SLRQRLLGGETSASTRLHGYLYADHQPIAEASVEQRLELAKLALVGGTPVFEEEAQGEAGLVQVLKRWELALQASDLRRRDDHSIDRLATAQAVAARAYDGFFNLSESTQARVVNYVLGQLPP